MRAEALETARAGPAARPSHRHRGSGVARHRRSGRDRPRRILQLDLGRGHRRYRRAQPVHVRPARPLAASRSALSPRIDLRRWSRSDSLARSGAENGEATPRAVAVASVDAAIGERVSRDPSAPLPQGVHQTRGGPERCSCRVHVERTASPSPHRGVVGCANTARSRVAGDGAPGARRRSKAGHRRSALTRLSELMRSGTRARRRSGHPWAAAPAAPHRPSRRVRSGRWPRM